MERNRTVRDTSPPFLFAPGGTRLLQIQPTLRCNLRCNHCYSSSGPEHLEAIPFHHLERFLLEARNLGYDYVGVSGGEPLLWDDLDQFLETATRNGYKTSVSTNATLMTAKRARALKKRGCMVAVSVDGPEEEHNTLRNAANAFARMCEGIRLLREAGVVFTLAFTFTRYNAGQLGWLYRFADEVGALGVHVHPLSSSGKAAGHLDHAVPDSLEFQVASYLMALLVGRRGRGGPGVIFDVVKFETLERCGWPLSELDGGYRKIPPIADLIPSLILEPDGCVSPFVYGFPRRWALAWLGQESLADAGERWLENHLPELSRLARKTLASLRSRRVRYVDLFSEFKLMAERELAPPGLPATAPPAECQL